MTPDAGTNKFYEELRTEHICSFWATLTPPEMIGPAADGIRANVYVTAGEVSGPKMRGRLRPVGGDWLLLRSDGVAVGEADMATMRVSYDIYAIR